MIEGDVRRIRELKNGFQADVLVGDTNRQFVTVTIVARSPEVQNAARVLRRAIQIEAAGVLQEAIDNGHKFAKAVGA